jgi:hypothetical protein
MVAGRRSDRFYSFQRPDRSAANVVRVLDAEQFHRRWDCGGKKPMGHSESGDNILWTEDPTNTGKETWQDAG